MVGQYHPRNSGFGRNFYLEGIALNAAGDGAKEGQPHLFVVGAG
jgi:hypothetical protein